MESKTAHKQKYMLEGKMRIIAMKVIQLNIANSTAYPEFDFFCKTCCFKRSRERIYFTYQKGVNNDHQDVETEVQNQKN